MANQIPSSSESTSWGSYLMSPVKAVWGFTRDTVSKAYNVSASAFRALCPTVTIQAYLASRDFRVLDSADGLAPDSEQAEQIFIKCLVDRVMTEAPGLAVQAQVPSWMPQLFTDLIARGANSATALVRDKDCVLPLARVVDQMYSTQWAEVVQHFNAEELNALLAQVWHEGKNPAEPLPVNRLDISTEQLTLDALAKLDNLAHLSSHAISMIACRAAVAFIKGQTLSENFLLEGLNAFGEVNDSRGDSPLKPACLASLEDFYKQQAVPSVIRPFLGQLFDLVEHQSSKLVVDVTEALREFVQDLDRPGKRERLMESLSAIFEDLSSVIDGFKRSINNSDNVDAIEDNFKTYVSQILDKLPSELKQDDFLHQRLHAMIGKLRIWALDPKYYLFGSWPAWHKPSSVGEGILEVAKHLGYAIVWLLKVAFWWLTALIEAIVIYYIRKVAQDQIQNIKISDGIQWIAEQLTVVGDEAGQQAVPDLLIGPLTTLYSQLAELFSEVSHDFTALEETHQPEALAIITQKAMLKQADGREIYQHIETIVHNTVALGKVQSEQQRLNLELSQLKNIDHNDLAEQIKQEYPQFDEEQIKEALFNALLSMDEEFQDRAIGSLKDQLTDLKSTPAMVYQSPDAEWTQFASTFNEHLSAAIHEDLGSLDHLSIKALLEQIYRAINLFASQTRSDASIVLTPINKMLDACTQALFSKPQEISDEERVQLSQTMNNHKESMWGQLSKLINTVAILSDEPAMYAELKEHVQLLQNGCDLLDDREKLAAWVTHVDSQGYNVIFQECIACLPVAQSEQLSKQYKNVMECVTNIAQGDLRVHSHSNNARENLEALRQSVAQLHSTHTYRFEEPALQPIYQKLVRVVGDSLLNQQSAFQSALLEQIAWLQALLEDEELTKPLPASPQHLEDLESCVCARYAMARDNPENEAIPPLLSLLYDKPHHPESAIDSLLISLRSAEIISCDDALAIKLLGAYLQRHGDGAITDFETQFDKHLHDSQKTIISDIQKAMGAGARTFEDAVRKIKITKDRQILPPQDWEEPQDSAKEELATINELLGASVAESIQHSYRMANSNLRNLFLANLKDKSTQVLAEWEARKAEIDTDVFEQPEATVLRIVQRLIDGAVRLQAEALLKQVFKPLENRALVESVMKVASASIATNALGVDV